MVSVNGKIQKIDDLDNEIASLIESIKKLTRYDNIVKTKLNVHHYDSSKMELKVDTEKLISLFRGELKDKRNEQKEVARNLINDIHKSGELDERFL